jgi:hypothetical protein
MTAPSIKSHLEHGGNADQAAGDVVVRWDAKSRRWAKRPSAADFGVVFLSTNDAGATAPTDVNVQAGDLWRRHPDAGDDE